jgi:hypothetical protein
VLHIVYSVGEGLGSERRGRADPIMAGDVKKDHLGVGAVQPGEVTSEDDIYEQYKKRMMLGYRYRPNPLVYCLPLSAFQECYVISVCLILLLFCRTIQGNHTTEY